MSWRSDYTIRFNLRRAVIAACLLLGVIGALSFAAYLSRAPLLTWVGHQLIDEDPLAPADAVVVLAGGVPGREIEAADLYARHEAPVVVLTRDVENYGWTVLTARGVRFEQTIDLRGRI